MRTRRNRGLDRFRNPRPERGMGAAAIVMAQEFAGNSFEMPSPMGMIQSRHSRRIVPISRSQNAFACGACLGVFKTRKPKLVVANRGRAKSFHHDRGSRIGTD